MDQLQEQFLKHVEQSQGVIRKVCAAYCFTPSDKEDMFQNILVQAWKAFPQFREEAAFSTWLYKIAICTAITANRKANPASTTESKYIDFFRSSFWPKFVFTYFSKFTPFSIHYFPS